MSESLHMSPPRELPPISHSGIEDSGGHVARVKVKYLVEKWIEAEPPEKPGWVLMARFSEDSDPDRRDDFCSALGGQVRVLDAAGSELSQGTYL